MRAKRESRTLSASAGCRRRTSLAFLLGVTGGTAGGGLETDTIDTRCRPGPRGGTDERRNGHASSRGSEATEGSALRPEWGRADPPSSLARLEGGASLRSG